MNLFQDIFCLNNTSRKHLLRLLISTTLFFSCSRTSLTVYDEWLPDLIWSQIPAEANQVSKSIQPAYLPSNRYVDGCRIVLLSQNNRNGIPVNLTPEFVSAKDPDVSFDGKTIIFTGKQNREGPWQIWRMKQDGSGKIQITEGLHNCIEPLFVGARFYLTDSAPTDQIVFLSTDFDGISEKNNGPVYSLYASDLNGENVHRLTFNLNGDFSPDVLPNGRVIFTSRQWIGSQSSSSKSFALMAVNIDGTDLMSFYKNFRSPNFLEMVRVSQNDRVYFIESNQPSWPGGGDLSFVSRRRPLHTHQILSHDSEGTFHSPCPLPDGELVASYRSTVPESTYGIYRISTQTGKRLSRIYADDRWHSVDVQTLMPHPRVEGRSTWVNYAIPTGVFYCLNSYITDRLEGNTLTPGSIKRLRVVEGLPALPDFQTIPKRILGVLPVEKDGSFHIKVPAETPLSFQLLDENNLALQTQQSWTWVMPNESRGCIGCHEDREMSPPNRLADALIKPPVNLTLPPEQRRMVDFQNEIAPIIQKTCSTNFCHSPEGAAPNLDLTRVSDHLGNHPPFRQVYKTLLSGINGRSDERYIYPGNARESPLIWMFFGQRMGSPDTPFTGTLDSLHTQDLLTSNELIQFIEWIDMGAQWDTRVSLRLSSGNKKAK